MKYKKLLVVSSALMFICGFFLGGIQLVLSQIATEFGTDILGYGMLVSAQNISGMATAVAFGALADKIGKKPVVILATCAFIIGSILASFSNGVFLYVCAISLVGMGYSVSESVCSAALNDIDPEAGVRYINFTQCLFSLGAVVSPQILLFLQNRYEAHWNILFILIAISCACLIIPLLRTEFPAQAEQQKSGNKSKAFFFSPIYLCLFLAIILYVGVEHGYGYFVQSFFAEQTGNADMGAYAISTFWMGMALSRLMSSFALKKPHIALQLSFAASALLFCVLLLTNNAYFAVALSGILGMAFGPIWSVLVAGAATAFPKHAAMAVGLMTAGCGLGGIIYPSFMGFLAGKTSIVTTFLILAITMAAGFVLCAVYKWLCARRDKKNCSIERMHNHVGAEQG